MEAMRLSRSDWPHVRRQALVALATLSAVLALTGGSYRLYSTADVSCLQAEATLQAARATLANVENERTELEASLPVYRSLVDRSIIGQEQRLHWRETLKTEQQAQAIGKLAFSLSPRQPFDAEGAGGQGRFRRYRSAMKLSLDFQREEALVGFLEGVAGQAHALAVIRGCQISRRPEPDLAAAGSLTADCTIDWATLERSAPGNPS